MQTPIEQQEEQEQEWNAQKELKKEKKWWLHKRVVLEVANDADRMFMREKIEQLGAVYCCISCIVCIALFFNDYSLFDFFFSCYY